MPDKWDPIPAGYTIVDGNGVTWAIGTDSSLVGVPLVPVPIPTGAVVGTIARATKAVYHPAPDVITSYLNVGDRAVPQLEALASVRALIDTYAKEHADEVHSIEIEGQGRSRENTSDDSSAGDSATSNTTGKTSSWWLFAAVVGLALMARRK